MHETPETRPTRSSRMHVDECAWGERSLGQVKVAEIYKKKKNHAWMLLSKYRESATSRTGELK
jgi:hypothetical protein